MGFELDIFKDPGLEAEYIEWLVDERSLDIQRHFGASPARFAALP